MMLSVKLFLAIKLFLSSLISFLMTWYLIPIFSRIAIKLNIMDVPDGKIKKHKKPTPYLGGIALYIGFIATLAIVFPFENKIFLLLIGSTLLLFLGLIDDILQIKPYQKFFWQLIVAFCFLKSGIYLKESFFLNNIWNIPISALWILIVTNAFNLVDVMDGLTSLLASAACITLFLIAIFFGQDNLSLLLTCFLGPLIAFFWYNRPPAKIYLGDAGSLFIGGFLGTVPFLFNWSTYNPYGFLTPIIILLIPLLEVSALILIRSYKGIPFYYGSPDHFSMYLQQRGWSKNQILGYILCISTILCGTSILVALNSIDLITFTFLAIILLFSWGYSICKKNNSVKII
ncbi:MAG: MraY family glycosyltransferase [Candidatus Babeliales bacterium]